MPFYDAPLLLPDKCVSCVPGATCDGRRFVHSIADQATDGPAIDASCGGHYLNFHEHNVMDNQATEGPPVDAFVEGECLNDAQQVAGSAVTTEGSSVSAAQDSERASMHTVGHVNITHQTVCQESVQKPSEAWLVNYMLYLWGLRPSFNPPAEWGLSLPDLLVDPSPNLACGESVALPECATTACRLPMSLLSMLPASYKQWIDTIVEQRPLRPDVWRDAFVADPDWPFLQYLVENGVHVLPVDKLPTPFNVPNHQSFVCAEHLAAPIVTEELNASIIVKQPAVCYSRWVHPLGAVPKGKDSVRVIHDLSAPFGGSVNALQKFWHRTWMSADALMDLIQPGDFIAKTDISAYFRHLPVHPAHWPLLAFTVDNCVYWDTRVPFGMRTAPEIADRVTQAICRRAASVGGIERLAAVVDDYTVFHQSKEKCLQQWSWLLSDLRYIGFSVHDGKSEGPAQQQKVLGIVWDSVAMTAALDADKVVALKAKLSDMLGRRKCTKRQLQSLLGHLYYASRVVFAGRTFVFHLAALLRSAHALSPHHHVYINAAAKADLKWWLENVDACNGGQAILPAKPILWKHFQTDASLTGANGSPCIGAWLHGGYFSFSYQELRAMFDDVPEVSDDINVWELYAVVVCCRLYKDYLAGKHWRVRSDNTAVVGWLMKGAARSPQVSKWLCEMMSLCLSFGFRLTAKHIPGAANLMADALSRRSWTAFADLLQDWIHLHSND